MYGHAEASRTAHGQVYWNRENRSCLFPLQPRTEQSVATPNKHLVPSSGEPPSFRGVHRGKNALLEFSHFVCATMCRLPGIDHLAGLLRTSAGLDTSNVDLLKKQLAGCLLHYLMINWRTTKLLNQSANDYEAKTTSRLVNCLSNALS